MSGGTKLTYLCNAVVLLAIVFAGEVMAQSATPEDRLRDALRQVTTQLREAQDQNADLQAKQQALEQQLSDAKAAPAAPAAPKTLPIDPQELVSLRRQLQGKTADAESLQQQLQQTQKVLAQWQSAYAEAADAARKRDGDSGKYQSLYQDRDTHMRSCEKKNEQLYELGNELLDRYEHKGVWEALKEDEPFVRLHRLELERLAQDYHGKLVDQKAQPDSPPDESKK